MAVAPPNPLMRPIAATMGVGANPADELKDNLADRRKKILDAARMGGGTVSQLLMGNPSAAPTR